MKIINGKRDNPETANKVACYDNGRYGSLDYMFEHLHRKRTGEFFLHHGGGPLTWYARSCGPQEVFGSEVITPMTESEARSWCAEHCDGEVYERIFGPVEEPVEE